MIVWGKYRCQSFVFSHVNKIWTQTQLADVEQSLVPGTWGSVTRNDSSPAVFYSAKQILHSVRSETAHKTII